MGLLSSDVTERVYDFITEDDEGRTCEAIPESACKEAPRNFVLNASNGSATKLAEQLASSGLVLPWLLSAIAAPAALAGLLVPIKEAGSLLPQLAVAGRIRGFPKRKWFWGGGFHPGSAFGSHDFSRGLVSAAFRGLVDRCVACAFRNGERRGIGCL